MQSNNYWSATEFDSDNAWNYNFNNGRFWWNNKTNNNYIRAALAYRVNAMKKRH